MPRDHAHNENLKRNSTPRTTYRRRESENTTLYRVISQNLNTFLHHVEQEGKYLPKYVEKEFEEFLRCGVLAHGFLRLQCIDCKHERLVAFSCKKRGFCSSCGGRRMCESAAHLVDEVFPHVAVRQWVLSFPFPVRFLLAKKPELKAKFLEIVQRVLKKYLNEKCGTQKLETGTVTFIQRFGGSLNLNPHLHMLVLDGCYDREGNFLEIPAPKDEEIAKLIQTIAKRIFRFLQKEELKNLENFDDPEILDQMQAASVQSLIAIAENRGGRVSRIGGFGFSEKVEIKERLCAASNGFSLHAGVYCGANDRAKLERLCRYVARPAVAEKRLKFSPSGEKVVYELKKAYLDGSTHLVFTPLQFMEKLAALVPRPRVHLTRFHGCLAPNAKIRKMIVPKKVVNISSQELEEGAHPQTKRIGWAKLLKRVFAIDMEDCELCGGEMKMIAGIMKREAITKILDHLNLNSKPPTILPARAPQQMFLF